MFGGLRSVLLGVAAVFGGCKLPDSTERISRSPEPVTGRIEPEPSVLPSQTVSEALQRLNAGFRDFDKSAGRDLQAMGRSLPEKK